VGWSKKLPDPINLRDGRELLLIARWNGPSVPSAP